MNTSVSKGSKGDYIKFNSSKKVTQDILARQMSSDRGTWDGRWRLVIWDIPEKRRQARDLLRFKLKQLGFKQWQKSIWASKTNCTILLRNFIKQVGIKDWVMVIESDNVGV